MAGTDAGIGITLPGFSIHKELDFYKQAGMSNFEVLETATINPSKTHDFLSKMGTIEVGKVANLLLVKNNPLEDLNELRKPSSVFIQGRHLSQEILQSFENRALERNNLIVSGLKYLEYLLIE